MSPGSADQHGHRRAERGNLAELFCDLSRLVDDRVAGMTDAEVDERLQRFLWSAGYARSGEGAAREAAAASGRHLAATPGQQPLPRIRLVAAAPPAGSRPARQPEPGRRIVAFGRVRPGMSAWPSSSSVCAALALADGPAPVPRYESGPDLDTVICELYRAHYQPLVRLAGLLVRDIAIAEEVVQDAFVAVHHAWPRLRDPGRALPYLRQCVVNRSRSVLRHRAVADKHAPDPPPQVLATEQAAIALLDRSAVVAALHKLPGRQREALVLRYYTDLSEADIAKAMGISRGAVKSHTTRGKTALRTILEEETT
jgi:RNA polymerase sigma-70 factor (sigma-E family)